MSFWPSNNGLMTYPGSEKITLEVTNKAGKEKTQSVEIQRIELVLPSQ